MLECDEACGRVLRSGNVGAVRIQRSRISGSGPDWESEEDLTIELRKDRKSGWLLQMHLM